MERNLNFLENVKILSKYIVIDSFHYHAAFSRDQEYKIYVQHLLRDHAELIYDLIVNRKCHIFLVGGSKVLPKSIDKVFKEIFMKVGNMSEEDQVKCLNYLKKSGRYYIETW